jgi:Mce-associated membrane protein
VSIEPETVGAVDEVAPVAPVADTEDGERRSPWFRRAVAVALLFALAGGVLQVLALRARHHPANANRALVDTEATAVVTGDVSNALGKIFSYAPDSTATTEQAAAEVLAGDAANEYRTLFAQVKQHAAAERLTVTTHVVRAGVVRLSGRTAQLLVFLDQVILRRDKPKGMSAAAQLSVTARLDDGHWRIVEIHAR